MRENVSMAQVMEGLRSPSPGETLEQVKTAYHTAVRVQVARDLEKIQKTVEQEMALAGSEAFYYWTVKQTNKETGKVERKPVTGMSIDGAMILVRNWGNCAVELSIDSEDPSGWTFLASFIDLQTGFTLQRLYRQRKSERHGKYENDRATDIAFQIGQSKAARNVVDKAMPVWLVRTVDKARESAASKYADLKKFVPAFVRKFALLGVTQAQLEAKVGKGINEWTPFDLVDLEGIGKAIKDGETTITDEFEPIEQKPAEPAQTPAQAPVAPAAASPAALADTPKAPEPPGKEVPIEDLVKKAMAGMPAETAAAQPTAPREETVADKLVRQEAERRAREAAAPNPVAQAAPQTTASPPPDDQDNFPGTMYEKSQPVVTPPTAPPAAQVAAAPAATAPPPGEPPLWARTILVASNIRAMNAAVMAAVKAGVPKTEIDPYAQRRRSELDKIAKGETP